VKEKTRSFFASFIVAILFVFASPFFAHAATYYVDSVAGNNANAGTSSASPWQTIAKVNSSTFNPGDSILFKAGDTWREQVVVPSSGASGNPITFGSYGTGALPIINGSNIVTGSWTQTTNAPVSQANMRLSLINGDAFVDFGATNSLTPYIGGKLTITDSSGHTLIGYIKAAGTGETYGSQLMNNTDFSTTNNLNAYNATIASVSGGQSGNALQVALANGQSYGNAENTFATPNGALIKTSAYFEEPTTAYQLAQFAIADGGFTVLNGGNIFPGTSWGQDTLYATTDSTSSLQVYGVFNSTGEDVNVDTASTVQVLTPSATGVTITTSATSSVYNWTSETPGFNANDPGGYTYTISNENNANLWQIPLATQPMVLVFNGTIMGDGHLDAMPNSSSGDMSWYWNSGVLYVYSATNPGSRFTSIEAGARPTAVDTNGKSYLVFNGLSFQKANCVQSSECGFDGAGGLTVLGASGNITIQNSEAAYNPYYGISVESTGNNIHILNSQFHDNNTGVGSYAYTGAASGTELLISGNNVYNNYYMPPGGVYGYVGGQAIQLSGNYAIVQNNLVANNGTAAGDFIGIHVYANLNDSTYGQQNIIRNNLVYGTLSNANDGGGIELDHSSAGSKIYGNVGYGNDGPCIDDFEASAVIDNNSCYNDSLNSTIGAYRSEIRLIDGIDNVPITVSIANNIADATQLYAIFVDSGAAAQSLTVNNNDFYDSAQANWYNYNNAVGSSFSSFNSFAGVLANLNANPLFTSPSTNIFTLTSSSPAINTGANLGSFYEFGLDPVSTWPSNIVLDNQNNFGSGWEIGAYVSATVSHPSIAFTSPMPGATVTSTISVTAIPTSTVGIASVQFSLDGSPLGALLTNSPYTISWNTTGASNGSHILMASTTDTNSNVATTSLSVTVGNTTSSDTVPPTAPSNLVSSAIYVNQINLVWQGSTDNVGVGGYAILRNGVKIATTPSSNLTYNDNSVSGGTTYTYTVEAYDAAGNYSSPSNSLVVTTLGLSSGGGSGGGGGGGGGGGTGNYVVTMPTVSASTTLSTSSTNSSQTHAELVALLAQLEAQLQVLLQEAAAEGITITTTTSSATSSTAIPSSAIPPNYVFNRNLAFGDTGYDVSYLQEFLIAQNVGPAARALKAHGVSEAYGNLTLAAVREFQTSVGIAPTGYFGVQTRAYVNSLNY
jgi:hypothetical protein